MALKPVRRKSNSGFTLVELGAVVVIVGILATLAVVSYRKYMINAKITEAQSMISAIRIAQEDRRSEAGSYADLGTTYCPGGVGTSNTKWAWTPTCNGGLLPWTTLAVHADGPVQFGYITTAGNGGTPTPPADASWVTIPGGVTTGPWFWVVAQADLDGVGSTNTILVGSSLTNQIFEQNVGQ